MGALGGQGREEVTEGAGLWAQWIPSPPRSKVSRPPNRGLPALYLVALQQGGSRGGTVWEARRGRGEVGVWQGAGMALRLCQNRFRLPDGLPSSRSPRPGGQQAPPEASSSVSPPADAALCCPCSQFFRL